MFRRQNCQALVILWRRVVKFKQDIQDISQVYRQSTGISKGHSSGLKKDNRRKANIGKQKQRFKYNPCPFISKYIDLPIKQGGTPNAHVLSGNCGCSDAQDCPTSHDTQVLVLKSQNAKLNCCSSFSVHEFLLSCISSYTTLYYVVNFFF